MKPLFHVSVLKFRILEALPRSWSALDFRQLAVALEYGDIKDVCEDDLRELCLMSLQDLAPQAAAELLLRHKLSGRLSAGQMKNIANEMLEEKLWEEYAEIGLHEELFNVGSVLYNLWPSIFPKPDAVAMTVHIASGNQRGKQMLQEPINESFVIRLLGDGMDEHATLHRLFSDKMAAKQSFPEAEAIIWSVDIASVRPESVTLDITSSGYWLDALRTTKTFESCASPDK